MIRAGDLRSARYITLCTKLGLFKRAIDASGGVAAFRADPSHAAPFAAAYGDAELALELLKRTGRNRVTVNAVRQFWHLVPHAAEAWLAGVDPQNPARVALREATGQSRTVLWPEHASYPADVRAELALMQANRSCGVTDQLGGLNDAFLALGQAPVRLLPGDGALSVTRLGGLGTARTCSGKSTRVSVVMTSFNCTGLVSAAMRSVLRQTWQDFELIVVDDVSTDSTWTEIQALAREDVRILPVLLKHNVGTYAAKNIGIEMATGDVVAFHDADDWAHPQRLEEIVRALQSPSVIAVSGQYVRVDTRGRFVSPRIFPLVRWTPNALAFKRKPVLARIGYFDENRFGCDSEFVARLRAAFGEVAHRKLPGLTFVASRREGSLMTGTAFGIGASGHSAVRRAFNELWNERLVSKLVSGDSLVLVPEDRSSTRSESTPA